MPILLFHVLVLFSFFRTTEKESTFAVKFFFHVHLDTLKTAWTRSLRPFYFCIVMFFPREPEYWMGKIEGMACFFLLQIDWM